MSVLCLVTSCLSLFLVHFMRPMTLFISVCLKCCLYILDYRNDPKFLDTQALANSTDQDQTAPLGAV